MKRYLPLFVFLPVSLSLFAYSWAQELPEIVINDADATTTIDLATPPADFFAVDNPPFLLPDEAAICHADAREVINLATPPEDFFDALEADLRLSDEVAICRADKRLTIDLVAPPAEFFDPVPEANDKFVYVALGDSYQSGEGAGNSVINADDYLNAYENGKNYPWLVNGQPVGTQTNTYVKEIDDERIVDRGNSCHRALLNYAKINKDKLEPEIPDEDVLLIDLTCSGAKIENGDQPPVVGDMASNQVAANSQVQQALDQLNQIGLTAADVDLVTVGMGGNDAKFADLVYACVLPGILRRALQEYPNPPAEINFLADQLATCENFDRFNFKSGDAISQLYSKEVWAQNKLLEVFGGARVLQLNYPNILPEKEKSPSWCSGIRKEDINYARKKIKEINKKIIDAFNANAANNPRLEFVNVENSLGDNALCPGDESNALANSINQDNFNAEIRRLLNLDGNGDVQSRALIDGLVSAYNDWKKCSVIHLIYINTPVPARLLLHDCDVDAAWGAINNSFDSLADYFSNQKLNSDILPNLIVPEGGGENAGIRFDRSKGLFHPNAKGHDIAACNVLSAYNKTSAASCLPVPAPLFVCSANGVQAGNIPFSAMPDSQIHIVAGGLGYGKPVTILHHSTQSELAAVVADNNGNIDVTITLPPASPGVHTIELRGDTSSGAAISQEIRVSYPGKPDGNGSYAVYLTGFSPNASDDGEIEKVNIDYADQTFGPYIPDENGGILVEVPLLDQTGLVEITAKSQTTGKVVEAIIEPIDSIPPEVTIVSPENNKTYTNDKILPITYQIADNQSATSSIETAIYLDDATATASSIDLSLQRTGNHKLEITSQDEAGNIGNASSTFVNSATIDSIIANISHYYDLKLVKTRVARDILLVSAKALKIQFAALDELKKNNSLPAKTRLALIKTAQTAINRQIDVFTALIKKQTRFVLDPQANALLTGSLAYIKIK
jgi:hypothetical protein